MRILVIEDDRGIADVIRRGLHEQQYAVDLAFAGEDGESLALSRQYDLIMLDLMLPTKSGRAVCADLRGAGLRTPIMVMTAHDGIDQREDLFRAGANDYIAKPFNFSDLLKRVGILVSAVDEDVKPQMLMIGDLCLDTVKRVAMRGDTPIRLTAKEFDLLEYFVTHRDAVLTPAMISERVWKMRFDPESNMIDSSIRFLKKKIDGAGRVPLIQILADGGYSCSESV
ncbi:MAG: response regulator [Chlorobi bacterium]|nr:response regulator [Chlorobiota bacterium]